MKRLVNSSVPRDDAESTSSGGGDAQHHRRANGVLGQSRGRLLSALCVRPQTAKELAEKTGTSANAVRVHLETLRAAGLVEFRVGRRGVGKPTHVFSLTSAGEYLLSNAYAPALQALLDMLRVRHEEDFLPLLKAAGASMAAGTVSTAGPQAALQVLETFGGVPTLTRRKEDYILRSACCPLAAIARQTPAICTFMEGVLSTAAGRPVQEQCERGEHPRCEFRLLQTIA